MESKIKNLASLKRALAHARGRGKKIVACSGSYDVLTSKHADLLEQFKSEGDVLVVFLNSDASVQSYKGPNRPIISQIDRALMLAALESVDYVHIFDEINPLTIIEALKPDVYCNGGDWGEAFLERDLVKSYGGRIYASAVSSKASTTDVAARILAVSKLQDVKAVFLDRDGVLIKDKGYLHQVKEVEWMPGALQMLKHLTKLGYLLIVITNQSGIGRGLYKRKDTEKVHAYMRSALLKKGITLTDIFYCPHTPEEGCECRKPKPGMLLQAAKKYKIALARSYMIGDKPSDIEAAKFVNCKTIFLGKKPGRSSLQSPQHTIQNLRSIRSIIKK